MNASQIAVATVNLLGLASGVILGYASRHSAVEDDPVVEEVDEILSQNQCGQCGYLGCRPCAETISCNDGKINRCVPDGEAVVPKITELLNVEPQPLDDETPELTPAQMVAVIDKNNCIGCTKCIQACLADAIIGATHAMHTTVSDLCTGYSLCADPCPTRCISLQPVAETPDSQKWDLSTIPMRTVPVEHHT